MAEMSEGAPAPVDVLPDEDEPPPDPMPLEPEPLPKGNEPLPDEPEAPPEPVDGLADTAAVEEVGHTTWPSPTPATTATTTTTVASAIMMPLRELAGALGAGGPAGGHPYVVEAPPSLGIHVDWGGGGQADWGGGGQVPVGGVGAPGPTWGWGPVGGYWPVGSCQPVCTGNGAPGGTGAPAIGGRGMARPYRGSASAPAGGVVGSGPVVGSEDSLILLPPSDSATFRGRPASGPSTSPHHWRAAF